MKILMINVVCGIRSTGRICADLATSLEKEGHEVKIAYGREYVPEQYRKYAVRIGSDMDVKFHGLKARLSDADGLGSKLATRRFLKWVDEFNPDIIHLHNLHGYYINVPLLFNYINTRNKRIIWTFHDMWPFTGHSGTCDMYNCEKWKLGCGNCPAYRSYPASIVDRSATNYFWKKKLLTKVKDLTIVTPSNWLAGLVKQSYLGDKKVVTIHNGINLHLFKPLENDFKRVYGIEGKIILMARQQGRNENKDLSVYYELAKKVDSRFKLVLVGLEKDQIKDLPYTILGIERTNSLKELTEICKAADVFVDLAYADSKQNLDLFICSYKKICIRFRPEGNSNYSDKTNIKWFNNGDIDAVVEYLEKEYLAECENDKLNIVDEISSLEKEGIKSMGGNIDGYFATRHKYDFTGKNVIIGVSAFWGKRKGLSTFVQLDRELSDDYMIVIVGLEKDNRIAFSNRVLVIPRTDSQEELRRLYAAADAFVNPTVQDNFPTVNLEASACNTPVITYDVGGSPENSYTPSCVIKKGDYSSLKKIIEEKTYEGALCITDRDDLGEAHMSNAYQKLYGI